ncbi:MAG: ABC transporter permease [Bacteroidia bacterium]|nr:ABC transporter permease [Bacteroidia bacterium]
MLQNYIKMAWRNLIKNKGYTFINVFGLTIGLAGCLLIGLFVQDELSYDKKHPDAERSYRVYAERNGAGGEASWAGTSPAISPSLKHEFPEVEQTLRMFNIRSKQLFKYGEISALEENGFFAEPSIFEIFHLPLRYGDPKTALEGTNSLVISYPLAQKYFRDKDPVGETLSINGNIHKVSAVLEPLGDHFHLDINFLSSFAGILSSVPKERMESWVWQDFSNYVKLYPQTDIPQFVDKLGTYVEKHAHPETEKMGFTYYLNLQKLEDIHLHSSSFRNDPAQKGNYQYVLGLSLIGLFLLFIACTNFINISTAQAFRRSQEVGVRKVIGALRSQLALQFMGEAIFIVAISMLFAAQITHFFIPELNEFTGKNLSFDWYQSPLIMLMMLGIILATGIFSGAYPALIISGFRPIAALKGIKMLPRGRVQSLRKSLLTLQYSLSTLLIITTIIVFQQFDFLGKKDLGFEQEQLLHFPMRGSMFNDFESTKAEFLRVPGITSASSCFGIPGDIVSGDNIRIPGENPRNLSARIFCVDHDYVKTLGLEILAGRDFSKEIRTDVEEAFLINETAMLNLGLGSSPEEAIGKALEWDKWNERGEVKKGRVVGVVKDFHYTSLHEEVQSTVLHIYPGAYWKMALRINTEELSQVIASVKQSWDSFETGYPIDYQFVEEGFGAMYEQERKLNSLLWIFSVLAITISCIGAFGLASYSAEQRRKEISIRKVLGASTSSIITLLSKDFLKLVMISLIIATPLAWYSMISWLESFAYRIDIQWWIFLLAGFASLLFTLITISFQSIKAANAKPVTSLKTE